MEKQGWKGIAILFIMLFVMETLVFIWISVEGTRMINKENICAYNICGDDPEIVYYEYFEYEEVCECYDADMNVIKQEYLG